MKFNAILLDVDGVIVDSERVFNACWRKAAEREGYAMTYEQALQLRSLDSGLAKKMFMDWYGDDKAYSVIRSSRKAIMTEHIAEKPLCAKSGVMKFLAAAKKMPVIIAVVTSSPTNRITSYLTSIGIDPALFDSIVTTEQVSRGKPYPDVYIHACRTIGIEPGKCIAVEDSPNGVMSAHTAGCFTVMIPDLSPFTEDMKSYVDAEFPAIDKIIDSEIIS